MYSTVFQENKKLKVKKRIPHSQQSKTKGIFSSSCGVQRPKKSRLLFLISPANMEMKTKFQIQAHLRILGRPKSYLLGNKINFGSNVFDWSPFLAVLGYCLIEEMWGLVLVISMSMSVKGAIFHFSLMSCCQSLLP